MTTAIRRPCDEPRFLPEFLEILAVAAGKPPGDSIVEYSKMSVYVIHEHLLDREPREVTDGLLKSWPFTSVIAPAVP